MPDTCCVRAKLFNWKSYVWRFCRRTFAASVLMVRDRGPCALYIKVEIIYFRIGVWEQRHRQQQQRRVKHINPSASAFHHRCQRSIVIYWAAMKLFWWKILVFSARRRMREHLVAACVDVIGSHFERQFHNRSNSCAQRTHRQLGNCHQMRGKKWARNECRQRSCIAGDHVYLAYACDCVSPDLIMSTVDCYYCRLSNVVAVVSLINIYQSIA